MFKKTVIVTTAICFILSGIFSSLLTSSYATTIAQQETKSSVKTENILQGGVNGQQETKVKGIGKFIKGLIDDVIKIVKYAANLLQDIYCQIYPLACYSI